MRLTFFRQPRAVIAIAITITAVLITMTLCVSTTVTPQRAAIIEAESLVDAHPDSALALLHTVDYATLPSASAKSLYALLSAEATMKIECAVTDTAALSDAAQFYCINDDRPRAVSALTLLATAHARAGDSRQAVELSLKALDLCGEEDEPARRRLYSLLTEIFRNWDTSASTVPELMEANHDLSHRLSTQRHYTMILSFSLGIILVMSAAMFPVCRLYRRRLYSQYRMRHKAIMEINDLKKKATAQTDIHAQTLRTFFSHLSPITDHYVQVSGLKTDSEAARRELLSQFMEEIKRLRSPESLAQLEQHIWKAYPDIRERLATQLPRMRKDDFTFFSLHLAGAAPSTLCLVFGFSMQALYNKRSRWRSRLNRLNPPDKDKFMEILDRNI